MEKKVISKKAPWFDYASKGALEDFYTIQETLGRGASSVVKVAEKNGTGEKYAVKILSKKAEKKLVQTEIGILLTLSHPHIIKLFDIYESGTNVYLVLERVTGGELFDRIVSRGWYSERDAAHALKQILQAVSYLHSKNIVHRDLKPENLLYADESDNSSLKVADFGLSRIKDSDFMKTVCGTPGYVAPEILLGRPYTEAVDIWAIGVIAYILLCGFEPFHDDRGDQAMFQRILKCDYKFVSPCWDDISLGAKDLVKKLLVLNPKRRLTAKAALEHPWVKGEAANFVHMDRTIDKIKSYNAKRRFWATAQTVTAFNRICSPSTSTGSNDDDEQTED
uniref:Calcium/calmodulin-dependent protein kinase type IV-like n=1 Tax=Ciona intestinalis TaxID=7719 RepID=A0A1W3JNN9_CIOIN|nr:calcium/calmodulin-dependent protein kinase type IV-like [Ciona intestinalis]XP_009858323.1 calcium/calmodulin-dependent protein kinase type IV-like [Ciona intestinalis]|eukprot:XP_002128230.1 calcium/calmodulin-dependent protein kinase type IV-like [Ciona intestinalis]